MSKSILLGLWASIITLIASYGTMILAVPKSKIDKEATYFGGVDYVKAPIVGVPIIRGKKLVGYVVAQFVFTIEQKKMKKLSVPPAPFLVDAAFQRIYVDATSDPNNMKKQKIDKLLEGLRADVNARYGEQIIKEVLIERMNFLPMDAVRSGTYETRNLVKRVVPTKSPKK